MGNKQTIPLDASRAATTDAEIAIPCPQETNAIYSGGPVPRVAIVDDEADIRHMLSHYLRAQGFDVRSAPDGLRLDRLLEREHCDVLILDLMMEPEDGLSICRRLRSEGHTIPILMLTARGDPVDRVIGLETGADDYLAKPFVPRELVARIHAMLRRQLILKGHTPQAPSAVVFGTFSFDISKCILTNGADDVPLNSAEVRLLTALAATPNRPISRENLMFRSRGREYEANERSVDVQVLRLRQIIEETPSKPRFLKTVWGSGYMLIADIIA
jgi:DNA-binding response OmpR family regulator